MQHITSSITTLSDRNATVAEVNLMDPSALYDLSVARATGSSKREPGDVYDESIAIDLAVGRALVNLGYQLIDRADAKVKRAAKVSAK